MAANFDQSLPKEKCNLTVDQSYASVKKEPNVMHENLMRLKQTVSPVRGSTQPGFTSFNEGL